MKTNRIVEVAVKVIVAALTAFLTTVLAGFALVKRFASEE